MLSHYQENIRQRLNQVWRMERKSMVTIKGYNSALNFLLDKLPVYFDEITTDDLVSYCLSIQSISKRDLQITMIRAVYRLVHNINLDWRLFPYMKRKKKIQPRFTTAEVQLLIYHIPNRIHKLIVLTQFAAGLRVGELIILKKKDLYVEPGCLFIDGEGISNDRVTPVPDHVHRILCDHMKNRKDGDYLFPGQYGGHISDRSVQKIISAGKLKAGINHSANTHGLRRGLATEMLNSGTELIIIRDILGHANVKTTEDYVICSAGLLKAQFNPAINIRVA